jgi:hypothetical protein
MQYIRCLNEQCKYYLEQRCTQGLVTVDADGLCRERESI